MTRPSPTRCPYCGTLAAEVVCHLCKQPRPVAKTFFRVARQTGAADAAVKHDLSEVHSGIS